MICTTFFRSNVLFYLLYSIETQFSQKNPVSLDKVARSEKESIFPPHNGAGRFSIGRDQQAIPFHQPASQQPA